MGSPLAIGNLLPAARRCQSAGGGKERDADRGYGGERSILNEPDKEKPFVVVL